MTDTLSEPLVTVVVPVYNVEKYLRQCVASISGQTHRNLEIILIDDGSSDRSGAIADELAQSDSRLVVHHMSNSGVSAARNRGLTLAKGEWVTFVDADDWIAPSFVHDMTQIALLHDADFVVSTSVLSGSSVAKSGASWRVEPGAATAALLYPGIAIGCWNKLYRLQFVIEHSIRFSPRFRMGEGLNFITDVSQRAVSAFTDGRLYYYRRDNEDSATTRLSAPEVENALSAIDNIERNLIDDSPDIELALDYHRWRTNFLGLVVSLETSDDRNGEHFKSFLKSARRHALLFTFRTPLSLRERAKTALMACAPVTTGRVVAARRLRRAQRLQARRTE